MELLVVLPHFDWIRDQIRDVILLYIPWQKPNRLQKPTAGARKKGAKHSEFLVSHIFTLNCFVGLSFDHWFFTCWYFPLLTTSLIKKPINNHILQQRTFYALWAPDPERLIRMLRVLFFIQSNLNNNRLLSVMKVKVLECIISMEASPLLPKCSLGVPLKSYENKLEFL